MKKQALLKALSLVMCMVLIAASACLLVGCADKTGDGEKVSFTFVVRTLDGNETTFPIETTEKTVGAALLAQNLIAGEQGDYGLYVKTVNGITLDYAKDGAYWSFYIGDDYAMTGVDVTNIENGATYAFRAESATDEK